MSFLQKLRNWPDWVPEVPAGRCMEVMCAWGLSNVLPGHSSDLVAQSA